MSLKYICLTIFLFLTFTAQLNLIPDKNNPIVIEEPTKASNPTVQIKFSFASRSDNELGPKNMGSSGLTYGQFFGLQFPSSLDNILNFDQSLKWSCELSDGTYHYDVKAVLPTTTNLTGTIVAAEKNIAYCQLIDNSTNVPLNTGAGITYTLKYTLDKSVLISFTRGLSLFTSTSNTPDKLIIDSLPQLGSFGIYDNWKLNNNNPFTIVESNIKVTSGISADLNLIYPGSVFDVYLKITCTTFIRAVDHVIVINYPFTAVTAPASVDSTDFNNKNTNQLALKGTLTLLQFGDNRLLLNGINEDLIPERSFYLNLRGFVALNEEIETTKDIEIYVLYKNTYSVLSYSSSSFIKVNKGSLIVSANHPEFWDIYRNAAWPIKFTIKTKINVDHENGLYVVIRHNNALDESANGGNIVTFVASTCDFSENSSFDNSYGNRPSCYPLRLDHNYINPSQTKAYNGSGIFFYLNKSLMAEQEIYLTVWVYADNCGGLYFNNISGSANTVPSFEVSIHKEIKANNLNESRFDFTKVLADGTGKFSGKCWNNKIQSFGNMGSEVINTGDNNFKADLADNIDASDPSLTLRFKEIFSWRIGSSSQTGYLVDISIDIEEKFLFSSSKAITSDSYFVVEADLNLASGVKLSTALPGSYQFDTQLPGILTVQFSKNWFTGTNYFISTGTEKKCFLSWALADPPTSNALNRKLLSIDVANPSYSTYSNFIGAAGHNKPDFDESQSNLVMTANTVNTKSNIMKLVSLRNEADGSKPWNYFPNEIPRISKTKVAWSTNCLKWNPSLQIKSLYTYIDIQFIWTYISADYNPEVGIFSNLRLIKLFPEGGVFHDKAKVAGSAPTKNPYINHAVLGDPVNGSQSSVCLVEINGKAISDITLGNRNSNVFALWMGFGTLLETDYSDASATYPVGNLVDGAIPYGLQSQIPMNPKNLYVSENYDTENVPLYVILRQLQNPAIFGGSSGVPQKGENTSSYHFLMGSLLLITGLSNANIQITSGPIYIPYYCPYPYPNNNSDKRKYLNFAPSIFGAWLSMENYSNINNLNRFLYYGDSDGNGGVTNKISVLLSRLDNSKTIKTGPYKGYGVAASSIKSTNRNLATLRWNAYTDENDYTLNVYNGIQGVPNDNFTCTGFSLFLNLNSVNLDKGVAFSIFNGKLGYYNSSRLFYVSGNQFKTAAFWGGLSVDIDTTIGNIIGKDPVNNENSFQIIGITRPLLESFLNDDGELVLSNKVGFSCVPADTSQYNALTNYLYKNNSPNFILDFTPSKNNLWNVSIEYDDKNNYMNDISGKIKFQISTPDTVPNGSLLVLNSPSFSQQTVCGMIVQGKYTQDCAFSNDGFKCTTPYTNYQFDICCYNIQMSNYIDITNLKVDFQTDNYNLDIKDYLSEYIYEAAIQNGDENFHIPLIDLNSEDIINTKSVTLSAITYDQSNQISGIGKVTFGIILPREPTKNMILTINGNLSQFIIQGVIPRCLASFSRDGVLGSNWDSGDAILNACVLNDSQDKILISTKMSSYKCGQTFLKTLYITLWPVILVDWNDNNVANNFQITLKNSNGDALALEAKNIKLNLNNSLKPAPNTIGQWDTLCSISSVTPRLPGELADYAFDIDLDTNALSFKEAKPNEVTIFWPFKLYGSFLNNISCYSKQKLLNCYFTDEGILNVRFNSILPVGSGIKIPIIVSGVRNPEAINDIIFPCTINQTNFSSGDRINVITGSGKLAGGITNAKVIQTGNLRFLSVNNPVSNYNPREISIHIFRISFDSAHGLTAFPIIINNTPVIYVYFPAEYQLALSPNQLIVSINEYRSDPNNNIFIKKTFVPSGVTVIGNRVTIRLKEESIDFNETFRYWDIIISNVLNPSDTLRFIKDPVFLTTSPYYVTLTNSDETALYTTLTNVNTYAAEVISGSSFNLISWNRGNTFNYDKSKWVLDIYSSETHLNKLSIKPGRYTVASYTTRSNSNIPHASAYLTLSDDTFAIAQVSGYNVVTILNQSSFFLVGAPCGTPSGYYVTKFTLSDNTNFAPLSPVVVVVDSSTKGIISFKYSSSVPVGGSTWIYISLNDYNFDTLNVNWTVPEGIVNDGSAKISNTVIKPVLDISSSISIGGRDVGKSVFTFTSSKSPIREQSFRTSDPNNCWTFEGKDSLSIKISGTLPLIGSDVTLTNSFKFSDASSDKSLYKNSLKYQFTPPIYPIYLYCVLSCNNYNFPADAEIINPKIENNNLLQFYSALYNNGNSSDLIFSNLVRGESYKLRCFAQSIEGDISKRSRVTIDLPNNTNSTLIPVNSSKTQCVQWNFAKSSNINNSAYLINLCQNIYSNGGFYNNGCVICTNSVGSHYVSEFLKPNFITCQAPSRLRFLQTAPSNTISVVDLPNSYTVCPIASQTCKTDVGPIKNYDDLFNQYIKVVSSNSEISLDSLNPKFIYSEKSTLDISSLIINITNQNLTGEFTLTAIAGDALRCYWQISTNDATSTLTWQALTSCSGYWCGQIRVGTKENSFKTNSKNLKAFNPGTAYNIFCGCTYDVPYPSLFSEVKITTNFTLKKPEPVDVAYSKFLNISRLTLIFIIALLFK